MDWFLYDIPSVAKELMFPSSLSTWKYKYSPTRSFPYSQNSFDTLTHINDGEKLFLGFWTSNKLSFHVLSPVSCLVIFFEIFV